MSIKICSQILAVNIKIYRVDDRHENQWGLNAGSLLSYMVWSTLNALRFYNVSTCAAHQFRIEKDKILREYELSNGLFFKAIKLIQKTWNNTHNSQIDYVLELDSQYHHPLILVFHGWKRHTILERLDGEKCQYFFFFFFTFRWAMPFM